MNTRFDKEKERIDQIYGDMLDEVFDSGAPPEAYGNVYKDWDAALANAANVAYRSERREITVNSILGP